METGQEKMEVEIKLACYKWRPQIWRQIQKK
jgi:hypothetical protein